MFSRNLRIIVSEIALASLLLQIVVGAIPGVFAINPPVHDLIQTHSAISSQAFAMDGTTYIAIANGLSGSPAEIVIPSASGTTVLFQTLPSSANSLEYFTVSWESYIAVADPYADDIIYHFDGSSFTGFQTLPSDVYATDFSTATLSGVDMLAIANSNPSSTSKMYAWTGTGFSEAYNLSAGEGLMTDVETFHIAGTSTMDWDYLALADGQIYQIRTDGATLIQTLPINGPADTHFITVGDEQMLAVLDHGSSQLFVYKLEGSNFILTQSIPLQTSWGMKLAFDTFDYQGQRYIVTPLWFMDTSAIYVYRDGQFELTQMISSTGLGVSDLHSSWTYFDLTGEPYLFLSNGFNDTNSAIYKWTPLPYVRITSPVSGEVGNYALWDPSRTPITGTATPGVGLSIYDGAGNIIGSGNATVSGEFSILTTANSGSVLPIRVVPYSNLAGEEKIINYLNIAPTPMPIASHNSMVYRDPFVFTVSGESSFYVPAPSPIQIGYDLYSNNIFSVSGEFNSAQSFSVSGEDTRIAYYGVDASGAITATQTRDFIYDVTKPTISENVMNAIGGTFILPGSAILKYATIVPPPARTIYADAELEIGRFAVTAQGEAVNLRKITVTNAAVTNPLTNFSQIILSNSVKLVDIASNAEVASVVTISWSSIIFDALSAEVFQDTTHNYKVVAMTSGFDSTQHDRHIDLAVSLDTVDRASGGPAVLNPGTLASVISTDYVVGTQAPLITLTKSTPSTFLLTITNPDSASDITINSIMAQVRPPAGGTYTADFCLRAEFSTDSCGSISGGVPGPAKSLNMTLPVTITQGATITREISVESNDSTPATLVAQVQSVTYNTTHTETYMVSSDVIVTPVLSPLTASLSKKSNNVFLVTVSNPNAQSVVLDSITAQVKPVANGPLYDGSFCLRIEWSLDDTACGSSTGSIPGPAKVLTETLPLTIGANSNSSMEIYIQSAFITPADLSAEVTALGYLGNQSPTDISYGPGGIGQSSPNSLYFVTGSTAQVYVDISDETIDFAHSGASLLDAATSFMSLSSENFISQGLYGMQMQAYGSYALTATRRHDVVYALTDLAGNMNQKMFSVYRLPSITGLALSVTGSTVITSFVSDIAGPVELSYVQWTATGKILLSAQTGSNIVALGAAVLTGTVTVTVGIEQTLSDITLPDTVYNALQQHTAYVFDTTPDAIIFATKTTITPGTSVDFGPVTLTGFNMPIDAHVTAGSLRVNSTVYGTGVTQVHPGDVVTVSLTAGSNYSSVYSGQLILGTLSPITYRIETSLAPVLVISVPGPGGGGGGAASASSAYSIVSGIISTQNNTSSSQTSALFSWLFLQNPASSNTIGQNILRHTSLKLIKEEVYKQLVAPVIAKSMISTDPQEQKMQIDASIQIYSQKMKSEKLFSSEYKIYRIVRKELVQFRNQIGN